MERRQFVGCAGLASVTALAGSAAAQESKAPAKGVKITVLKTTVQKDLESIRGGKVNRCDRFEEGHEFVVEVPWYPPEGFCQWAWADIRTYIGLVHTGGMEQTVACCTDGFRPVFFKLERLS